MARADKPGLMPSGTSPRRYATDSRLTPGSPGREPGDRRLTRAAGRKFGLTLAAGFAVVGALLAWRGHSLAARICWAIAAASAASGLLFPTRLGPVERVWMALGVALSHVTRPVFFTLVYLAVITPAGLIRRFVARSPLARDSAADTYWVSRTARAPDAERRALERQF